MLEFSLRMKFKSKNALFNTIVNQKVPCLADKCVTCNNKSLFLRWQGENYIFFAHSVCYLGHRRRRRSEQSLLADLILIGSFRELISITRARVTKCIIRDNQWSNINICLGKKTNHLIALNVSRCGRKWPTVREKCISLQEWPTVTKITIRFASKIVLWLHFVLISWLGKKCITFHSQGRRRRALNKGLFSEVMYFVEWRWEVYL